MLFFVVKGMMYYSRALKLQAFLDIASDQGYIPRLLLSSLSNIKGLFSLSNIKGLFRFYCMAECTLVPA